MSTVGSRSSHRYSTTQTAANGAASRRLSTLPFSSSPINERMASNRRVSTRDHDYDSTPRNMYQNTEMVTNALAKAQTAVLLDQRNDVVAALDCYSQVCTILVECMAKEPDPDDLARLQQIYDTYTSRMHVLSTMHPLPLERGPPVPSGPRRTQSRGQDFEDDYYDETSTVTSNRTSTVPDESDLPTPKGNPYFESRPIVLQSRQPLHRTTSSKDSSSTSASKYNPSSRKPSHSRTSSYTLTVTEDSPLSSLEQIPNRSSASTSTSYRSSPIRDSVTTVTVSDLAEEEMDDAAFLERITRGFTSDEDNANPLTRPSTSSSSNSQHQSQQLSSRSSDNLLLDPQYLTMARTESEGRPLPPSPLKQLELPPTAVLRQPSPPPKPKHDRARGTSSPLPGSDLPTPRPASSRKNLSVSGAQPMLKSLSANNAIPNANEMIVMEPPSDIAPAVPPKIKKRPHLIRVVSESTMRTNYGSRLSTFEVSPVTPPSSASITTPGTTGSSSHLTDNSRNLIHDRDGAVPPEDPPEDPYLRPYWLMRALTLSMKNQKGAYINSRLFIPQGVWTLKNAKLKAMEDKIACFNTLAMAVRQILDMDHRNVPVILQEVVSLEATMDAIQQNLLKKIEGKMNGSNGANGERAMGRKMSQTTLFAGWNKRLRSKSTTSSIGLNSAPISGKDVGVDGAYPNALLALFESAMLLGISLTSSLSDVLEQRFESLDPEDMPIKFQLRLDASRRRIAEFFANVVLRFVLQDLSTLMSKYVKRVNEWMMS